MKIYRSLAELPHDLGTTVATIGNFDGVHRGHQWVIAEVIARTEAINAAAASSGPEQQAPSSSTPYKPSSQPEQQAPSSSTPYKPSSQPEQQPASSSTPYKPSSQPEQQPASSSTFYEASSRPEQQPASSSTFYEASSRPEQQPASSSTFYEASSPPEQQPASSSTFNEASSRPEQQAPSSSTPYEPSSRPEQRTASSSDAEWRDPRISSSACTTQTDNGQRTTSLAITLDPHPARVLGKQTNLTLITPLEEKLALLAATGIDAALILPFDLALSHLTAREFASQILRDAAHVIEVHEGENFRFGHHAEAGTDGLAQLGAELGFTVKTYAPRSIRGEAVSSSRIRKLIATGDVSHARALLGRPFSILSTPASGRGYGTKYTVPTINLAPYAELLPANGVYITTIKIEDETFESVTNVGSRPTFGHIPGTPDHTVESHLLNFHPIDLTESTPIRLTFLKFLRPEIKWPNPEALRTQIGLDVARAGRFFTLCKLIS